MTGAGAGVIRSIHGDGDLVSDLIPCDFVVNCIIVAGASVATSPKNEFKVYNCTSSTQLPITWNEFLDMGRCLILSINLVLFRNLMIFFILQVERFIQDIHLQKFFGIQVRTISSKI